MRMTQEQLDEYTAKRVQQAEQREKNHKRIVGTAKDSTSALQGLKLDSTQKKSLVVVLPFKLPTWNALLAMNRFQRAKERHRIHAAVQLACIASAKG